MEARTAKIVVFFLFGLTITEVVCGGVKVKKLDVQKVPNDIIGEVETEVKNEDEVSAISIKVPLLKDFGEGYQVTTNLKFNNIPILKDQVLPLCEAIKSDGFFKPVVDKIEPIGKFPSACPIPAGTWEISDFKIDTKDFLPLGITPSGDFEAVIVVGKPNADPIAKITVSGSVSSSASLPGLFSGLIV